MQIKDKFIIDINQTIYQYQDMVYRLAKLNARNVSEVDDIFQEVFIRLMRYRNTIESEEHLKAWLIRVTINQCRKNAVSAWARHHVSMEEVEEHTGQNDGETEIDYSSVYEAVKELPPKYKEVIHLFYYEELSVKEIARVLSRSESNVKTQLNRGRQMLNDKLKGAYCYVGRI